MNLLILMTAFAGFSALCLSMERHAKQALDALPTPAWRLGASTLGWGLLLCGLAWSLREHGVSIGIAAWLGFLTLA
ncbi:MAG: DUF3325 domain-containing protein, partial [Zoogloeaceae bacterium]|nr:DUF3325 domain-containing protein [Zoogloeaceae bacterium]